SRRTSVRFLDHTGLRSQLRNGPERDRMPLRQLGRRLPNRELRTRGHLTEKEVERLIKAAGDNRYGHRDATMLLMSFRHGLRASEVCDLRWIRSILMTQRCTSAGLRMARPAPIL